MTIMTDAGLAETAFHFLETLQPTRLIASPELARRTGVGRVLLKIEADRPLGNFKQLGGMFAGLLALARSRPRPPAGPPTPTTPAAGAPPRPPGRAPPPAAPPT